MFPETSPRRAHNFMASLSRPHQAAASGHAAEMRNGTVLDDRRPKHATNRYNGETMGVIINYDNNSGRLMQ